MDELTLLQRAQRGSIDAFNALVLRYQASAYNLAYRIIGEREAAADATQDAFIAAYNHLPQFRSANFKAWLMRIVVNACYDELRRRKRRPAISIEDLTPDGDAEVDLAGDPGENPETVAQQNALNRAIQDCLNGLPTAFRAVAVLADVQGYEYHEIAEIVRVSLGTVKSRLSRARQRLRDCLQGAGELLPDAYRLASQIGSSGDSGDDDHMETNDRTARQSPLSTQAKGHD